MVAVVVACAVAAAAVSGCAYATAPVLGALYTNVQAPITATGAGPAATLKTGTAYATSILGLIATGDASIATAARNGGITKIHHVDYTTESILGVYAKFTVKVTGE
jgi:hypothetical protein